MAWNILLLRTLSYLFILFFLLFGFLSSVGLFPQGEHGFILFKMTKAEKKLKLKRIIKNKAEKY